VFFCVLHAFFTIAKPWKQPGWHTTDEWIKKIHLYTMEFYSATKKNEILSFARKWMELENNIFSEVSQVQKSKSHVFSHMWNIDLIQIQQHYEKQVTLREVTIEKGR
jgi:hypothetical protein